MPRSYTGKSKNQFGFAKPKAQRKSQVKGKTERKYKNVKSKKGKDKVLNTGYLDKRYLLKSKMELKLSTFNDTTCNDDNEVPTNVVGDTVEMNTEFFEPSNIGSVYAYTSGGYGSADAGYCLLQYGQNLTDSYASASLTSSFPTGSFSWQTVDTMAQNFDDTLTPGNHWGNDNKQLVVENPANIVQGDYVTLKRSIYNLEITMRTLSFDRDLTDSLLVSPGVNGVRPIEFRVLHLLPNRKVTEEASDSLNVLQRLWLLPTGKQGGILENSEGRGMNNPPFKTQLGFSPASMFDMPIDRSYYHTISDQKFILQNPASSLAGYKGEDVPSDTKSYLVNQSTINNKFPTSRKLTFVVNYESDDSIKKRGDNKVQLETKSTGFVAAPSGDNINYYFKHPKDMNYRDIILILSKSAGTNEAADSGSCQLWTAAGYGSLSAYDN